MYIPTSTWYCNLLFNIHVHWLNMQQTCNLTIGTQKPEVYLSVTALLKLLWWMLSETKSDYKFGLSILWNSLGNFLERSGQPVAFSGLLRFSLDDTCKWYREKHWLKQKVCDNKMNTSCIYYICTWELICDTVSFISSALRRFSLSIAFTPAPSILATMFSLFKLKWNGLSFTYTKVVW